MCEKDKQGDQKINWAQEYEDSRRRRKNARSGLGPRERAAFDEGVASVGRRRRRRP